MNRLEELKAQKRAIEQEIKELTYGRSVRYRDAKLDTISYSGPHLPDWRVMVWTYIKDQEGKERKSPWRSISVSSDRQDAINHIQPIIDSLTGLLERLKGETDESNMGT